MAATQPQLLAERGRTKLRAPARHPQTGDEFPCQTHANARAAFFGALAIGCRARFGGLKRDPKTGGGTGEREGGRERQRDKNESDRSADACANGEKWRARFRDEAPR